MSADRTGQSEREQRLNDVLLDYVEKWEAGREPNREQILAAHPDLRAELESFLASHDELERLAAPLRVAVPASLGGETVSRGPGPGNQPAAGADPAAASDPPPAIGQLGDFRLLREVGRGGMGVVYEAEQISLRRRVALKVLPFAAAIDARQLQRFKNEALAAANLRHKSIVSVHAVGTERGVHYYAMEFIEGQSLATLIAELRTLAGVDPQSAPAAPSSTQSGCASVTRLTAASISQQRTSGGRAYYDWVAGLGRQAALALEHAHQMGVVHRDIKPANLLLDAQGQLWVTDFGLAQVSGDAGITMTGEILGTLRYASPEQVQARRGVVDHRSDVYSLGATLYELLTLRRIFEGCDRNGLLRQIAEEEPRSPRSCEPAIPPELETIVLKAIGKEPVDRYDTAQELAEDLQRFLEDRPIVARRPAAVERLRKWARRHPSAVVSVVVVLLLSSVGSLVSTGLIRREQQRTKAEQAKTEAAYQRERERAEEAEARFRLARRSVDELIRVSEEELTQGPGMEGLRMRLLTTALSYYLEFVAQRQGDPAAQADLLDTTRHVEQILTDVGVLRGAGQWSLLGQPAVLDDLRMDDRQRAEVRVFLARVEKEWLELFRGFAGRTPAERARQILEQARAFEAEAHAIMTPTQLGRLQQIGLQLKGAGAFRDPEIAASLELTAEQRDQIQAIEEASRFVWMKAVQPPGIGTAPGPDAEAGERPANERILALLTDQQSRKWQAMTGEPFRGLLTPLPAVWSTAPAQETSPATTGHPSATQEE
jgi:eukaryotic-like serine/threonine-protein kinase